MNVVYEVRDTDSEWGGPECVHERKWSAVYCSWKRAMKDSSTGNPGFGSRYWEHWGCYEVNELDVEI